MEAVVIVFFGWVLPGIVGSIVTEIVSDGYDLKRFETSVEAIFAHIVIGGFIGLVSFGAMLWIVTSNMTGRLNR